MISKNPCAIIISDFRKRPRKSIINIEMIVIASFADPFILCYRISNYYIRYDKRTLSLIVSAYNCRLTNKRLALVSMLSKTTD
jgi:hypothetical protein